MSDLADKIKQMMKRLDGYVFNCIKCNKPFTEMKARCGVCPDCGYDTGKSASMQLYRIFDGIDVPPELMDTMKYELENAYGKR